MRRCPTSLLTDEILKLGYLRVECRNDGQVRRELYAYEMGANADTRPHLHQHQPSDAGNVIPPAYRPAGGDWTQLPASYPAEHRSVLELNGGGGSTDADS